MPKIAARIRPDREKLIAPTAVNAGVKTNFAALTANAMMGLPVLIVFVQSVAALESCAAAKTSLAITILSAITKYACNADLPAILVAGPIQPV